MTLQTFYYLSPLIISTIISASLAIYAWQHRETVGAKSFSLLMVALFQWTLSYIFRITTVDLAVKLFWDNITFIGITITPVVWFIFSLEYAGHRSWLTRFRVILLLIMPALTTLIIWTNDIHQLFWTTRQIRPVGDILFLQGVQAPWFWVHAGYSYVLILIGMVFIVRALLNWPEQYRAQMIWILFAVITPWIANVITIFDLIPLQIDLTPFAFTITGGGMAVALFRHRLLELAPIARDIVIEGLQDAMIVLDASGNIVDINETALKKLNLASEDEAIGKKLVAVLEQWPELLNTYRNATEGQIEIPIGEGEQQRWFDVRLTSLHERKRKQGRPLGQLILARDITARKRTENLLSESEARFRQIVENANDFIYRTDASGNFTYANPAALKTLGYTSEDEVLGKHFLEFTTPEARHRMNRTYQLQFLRKTPNSYHEFPALTRDGRELWFGQNVQLLTEGNQVVGFQVLARDMTAIKQAQDALQIAYDQALEASRAKSQLLAKVSHELRTPLGGIIGYAELLRDGVFGAIKEEQEKATNNILESANYLASMVNELLDEAQANANTTTLQERSFSPEALLQQATSGLQVTAEKKGLELGVSCDKALPQELYGDDNRLRQIISNLVSNAIKFTHEGRVQVNLRKNDAEHWMIQVTDTGIGIPPEAQATIFDPFKQADNAITRDNPGIGLGLSITKQLVDLMGGQITLDSQVGVGSTFNILLPVKYPPTKR